MFNSTSAPTWIPILPPEYYSTSTPELTTVWWDKPGAHPGCDALARMAQKKGRSE